MTQSEIIILVILGVLVLVLLGSIWNVLNKLFGYLCLSDDDNYDNNKIRARLFGSSIRNNPYAKVSRTFIDFLLSDTRRLKEYSEEDQAFIFLLNSLFPYEVSSSYMDNFIPKKWYLGKWMTYSLILLIIGLAVLVFGYFRGSVFLG